MPTLARNRDELERQLRRVQPAARVVSERYARRAVRHLTEDGESVAYRPDNPIWLDADLARSWDILPADDPATGRVVLLVDPDDWLPDDLPDAEVLRNFWRLLVRAEVMARCDRLGPDAGIKAIAELGPAAWHEVGFVLVYDRLIPPEAGDVARFRAFAAEAADRLSFAPESLRRFFPSVGEPESVRRVVGQLLGEPLAAVAGRLRPAGAAADLSPPVEDNEGYEGEESHDEIGGDLPARAAELARQARDAADVGNHVRSAILRARAARLLTGPEREAAEAAARSAIRDGLVARLAKVFDWDYPTARQWSRALIPVLGPAAGKLWPRAARGLYDLQKIPGDLERELYAVEPAEWVRSLGRRPIRRSLHRARHVILLRHLSSADRHLARVRLNPEDRDRLHALIRDEMHRAERRVRDDLGPIIRDCLNESGLRPATVAERVAQDKVIAELLDRACGRGYLRLSDLRDAVARNQLKLPDLRGPVEFVVGDPLLRADERLGEELGGVYHRGEIYLRWIQRLTALGFGTVVGRWLSRYLLLPFGGGVMTVEFAKYVTHEAHAISEWLGSLGSESAGPVSPPETAAAQVADAETPIETVHAVSHEAALGPQSLTAAVVLGFIYFGLVNVRPFRVAFASGVLAAWRGLRFLVADLPLMAWRAPLVRAIRRHPLVRFGSRRFGSALVIGSWTGAVLSLLGFDAPAVFRWAGLVFAGMAAFTNTPFGRVMEDRLAESLADAWRVFRVNLIPGLIGAVIWAFRRLAGLVERTLYGVDEWLRFRPGQSEGTLAVKVALAALWFPVAYLTRFAFYLLIEPQINPLKHFPVVTVSHKLLLPMVPGVASATGLSAETVFLIVACIPGVFGFIAWELKENWRLYAANRPAMTPPARVGHHGETMRGLLRPGFHSGTVPKLYGRLRAAIRSAEATGRAAALARSEHELEEVAEAVAATARRELIPLLELAGGWAGRPPAVGEVHVGVQQIMLDVVLPDAGEPPLRLAFAHLDGRIFARIERPGWAARLSPEQQAVLGNGLGGLAELLAAVWQPDPKLAADAPGLSAELRPRPWEERSRYWERVAPPLPHNG